MIRILFALVVMAIAAPVYAVDFYTAPTIDVSVLGTLVTSILAALALVWAARKGVKMINRS